LRGLVLPVGGIKEKVLAAKRAGLSRVLLPDLNRRDLEEIPPAALEGIQFEFLKTVDEALAHALEPSEDSSAIPNSPSRGRGERGADTSATLDLRRR
jgi:ATP-dependent Lon protease